MIVINSSTRQFNIPGADLTFGVEFDSGSERKYFQCPRYVGNNLDIASSFVRINYRNANGEIDSYLVEDLAIDGDNVTFSWELYPKVTAYKGQIRFVMCVVGPDTKVAWHTTLGTGIVLEGLEPDNAVIQAGTADVVAQLISMVEKQTAAVEDVGAEWVQNVQSEGTDQIVAVQTAGAEAKAAAVAEIEAKGVNTLASIPEDYTSLESTVDTLNRTRGVAIVCEAAGSAVAVNDASDMAIQGMKIFGRSTQDGTPTPDAPVEIVSVESPSVLVSGKNLLNLEAGLNANFTEANGIYTLTRNDDASRFSYVIPLSIPANTEVTFSFELVESTKSSNSLPFYYIGESGEDYYLSTKDFATSVYSEPITGIRFYLQSTEEIGAYIRVKNVQIEMGSVATAYEPYKALQTIETTHTLRGIPVTSGGNYTDSNGQQWICDEVDLERGVYVQRIYEQTILANKVTTVDSSFVEFGTYCSVIADYPVYVNNAIRLMQSDFALGVPTNDRNIPEHLDKYRIYLSNTAGFAVRYPASAGIKTIEDARNDFAGRSVSYVLATPIETPLSETEIAAYRAMHSNYPNTSVLNSAGAHMVVKYAADTKLYIDNKIAALMGG